MIHIQCELIPENYWSVGRSVSYVLLQLGDGRGEQIRLILTPREAMEIATCMVTTATELMGKERTNNEQRRAETQ